MTTTKITLEKTKKEGLKFAFGVSTVVLIQAYIALIITKYIHNNDNFVFYITVIGALIFGLLSIYFFIQAFGTGKKKIFIKYQLKNSFVIGLLLSTLNMFAIPFYCGVGSALNIFGLLDFDQISIVLFVVGSALGTFMLLYAYASSAIRIQSKAGILTKNLNLILGIVTGLVSIITIVNLL